MEVLVFKTNIGQRESAPVVRHVLEAHRGITRWDIDFSDRDKVLRVEARAVQPAEVIRLINAAGFECEELA